MNYLILFILLVVLPSASALDLYYNVTITYNNGEVTLDSWSVVPKEDYNSKDYDTFNDYAIVIKTEDKVSDIYYFDFNLVLHAMILINETEFSKDITLDKNTISVYLPYDKDAVQIAILDAKSKEPLLINLKGKEELAKPLAAKPTTAKPPFNTYLLIGILVLIIALITWLALKKDKRQ